MLLLLVSAILYLYDNHLKDQDLLKRVESKINEDFQACLGKITQDSSLSSGDLTYCHACELTFFQKQFLTSWKNKEFLPAQKLVNKLEDIPKDRILTLGNRTYFQIRKEFGDSLRIMLIPLQIEYEVRNNFLLPFVFLGRSENALKGENKQKYLNTLQSFVGSPDLDEASDIHLYAKDGKVLVTYRDMPTLPFRRGIRIMVVVCIVLGGIMLAIYSRIHALQRWQDRYYINFSLFVGVILIRVLMYYSGFPSQYIDLRVFAPDVLAFHFLAPSLGELTINIFTFTILVWIGYTYFFRLSNILYRKIINHKIFAWPAMLATIGISSWLLKIYVVIFRKINVNSLVDLEFANFYKADIYSFLILLDVGVLLLAIGLIIFSLLKLNALFIRKNGLSIQVLALHILGALIFNILLHPNVTTLALITTVSLLVLGSTVVRIPSRPILHQDLATYITITLIFSLLVTYNISIGVNLTNQIKAQQIPDRILGSQVFNTVFAFRKTSNSIKDRIKEVRDKKQELADIAMFEEWIRENFFAPNFKEFKVELAIYDQDQNRLDKADEEVPYGPHSDFPLEIIGEEIAENLYQLPNAENKYLDLYVGSFVVNIDSVEKLEFATRLSPNKRETEGLYPSLSLEQGVYDDIKLIKSFDHALYRNGILYSEQGKAPFPIYLENPTEIKTRFTQIRDGYQEIGNRIGKNKIVIVRYPKQSMMDLITTFSFIFYFYVLATVLLIILPVLGFRSLRSGQFSYQIPLRAKIRLGLFSISAIPLILIVVLLSYFIRNRYNEDAKEELGEEAGRITQIIEQDYLNLHNDPFSRITLYRDFQETIENLEPLILNDINIFDEFGKRVASTQPLMYNAGISSDLMNEVAFDSLQNGELSGLVIKENIGDLEYFSGYRPIIGNNDQPIGYVNIPYLAQQDQLDDQVTDFLAYLANIYLLIFLLINVAAVVVSSRITQPLSMIQQRLSSISLGNINEPITYESQDEIGAIVNAYNKMVNQLAESEEKLSQSQREMAWRQMARQVAHEIKNPLTPMKLSIQHLVRAWNENSPRLQNMFPKVMKTLLVQIDSMVRIANSFSEFAKMPEPVKSRVLVNEVLLEVVDLYTQSEETIWLIDVPEVEFWAFADRDQLSRSFNNIIKNGLQAIEDNGIIHISMRIMEGHCRIEIKDNGSGIPPEVQKKIFEPSFSTKTSGMGLGLAIVKRIIENTGGVISFESKEGKGTTFFIEIPSADDDIDLG
ncbi:MAG: HAMP domain-containing protein [Bacteroidetes bacterium]|nr:HAMP domain-containing protein [Bacteroidota bacterium]